MSAAAVCDVVAYTTSRMTHEIGVWMALGASLSKVCLLIFRQASVPFSWARAFGIALTTLLLRVLRGVSDKIDCRKLAERLRLHDLKPVYHGQTGICKLRELARSYLAVVKDLSRVINKTRNHSYVRSRTVIPGQSVMPASRRCDQF